MKLQERAPVNVYDHSSAIESLFEQAIAYSNILKPSLWRDQKPKLTIKITGDNLISVDITLRSSNIQPEVILGMSYVIHHNYGIVDRIKLKSKIEPLQSDFMKQHNITYFYKMFKNNDLVHMIDNVVNSKQFTRKLSVILSSSQNESTGRYYTANILPLLQDSTRVDVMNRDSQAIYDITKDYYRQHSAKYILIKKSPGADQQTPLLIKKKSEPAKSQPVQNPVAKQEPTIPKVKPSPLEPVLTDAVVRTLKPYAGKKNIEILILKAPKYKFPNVAWSKSDTIYLCTLNDREEKIFVDLYVNTKLTKSIDAIHLLYANDELNKASKVTSPSEENNYFNIGYRLYRLYDSQTKQ